MMERAIKLRTVLDNDGYMVQDGDYLAVNISWCSGIARGKGENKSKKPCRFILNEIEDNGSSYIAGILHINGGKGPNQGRNAANAQNVVQKLQGGIGCKWKIKSFRVESQVPEKWQLVRGQTKQIILSWHTFHFEPMTPATTPRLQYSIKWLPFQFTLLEEVDDCSNGALIDLIGYATDISKIITSGDGRTRYKKITLCSTRAKNSGYQRVIDLYDDAINSVPRKNEVYAILNLKVRVPEMEARRGGGGPIRFLKSTGNTIIRMIGDDNRFELLPPIYKSEFISNLFPKKRTKSGQGARQSSAPDGGESTLRAITSVAGESTFVAGNNASVAGNSTSVAGDSTSVAGNSTSVAGNSTSVAGNSTSVAGNSTSVAGNSTSVAGNSTSVAGNSTSVAGVSTSVAGVSTSVAGASTSAACATINPPSAHQNPSAINKNSYVFSEADSPYTPSRPGYSNSPYYGEPRVSPQSQRYYSRDPLHLNNGYLDSPGHYSTLSSDGGGASKRSIDDNGSVVELNSTGSPAKKRDNGSYLEVGGPKGRTVIKSEFASQNPSSSNGGGMSLDNFPKKVYDFVDSFERLEVRKNTKLSVKHMDVGVNTYPMRSNPRGIALIINNYVYPERPKDDEERIRAGSQRDVEYLQDILKVFKFDVEIKSDVSTEDLPGVLKRFKENAQKYYDACVVAILSHGAHGLVEMVDSKFVRLPNDIIHQFDRTAFPEFAGKPKVFLIQTCQEIPTEENVARIQQVMPDREDEIELENILECYAACSGTTAGRDMHKGSHFIYLLVDALMDHAHDTDFETILKLVQDRLPRVKRTRKNLLHCEWKSHRFNKKLFFNPGL